MGHVLRNVVIGLVVQFLPRLIPTKPAPLLDEARDACWSALAKNRIYPPASHWTRLDTRLATNDYPRRLIAKQRDEPRLHEVLVMSKRLRQAAFPHDLERSAVG